MPDSPDTPEKPELLRDAIQLLGRDAGPYVAPHFGQRPAHEKVVLAEQFDLFFVL